MHYAIDIGHNSPTRDLGAGSRVNSTQNMECKYAKQIGDRLIQLLQSHGHQVTETCPYKCSSVGESLKHRVSVANDSKSDLFVSIHLNAHSSNARGTEVFVYSHSSPATKPARKVLQRIVDLGFINRGLKTANFYVLANTLMPAMLIEVCFITSSLDMKILDVEKAAIAIYEGLTGEKPEVNDIATLQVVFKTPLKSSTTDTSQYSDEEKEKLNWLEPGKYRVEVVGEEESHYYVQCIGDEFEGRHFVYSGHCKLFT